MLLPSHIHVRKLHHLTGHRAGIYALTKGLSPRSVLSGGGDGYLVQWDLALNDTGSAIAQIPGKIFSLLHLPDLQLLFAGTMEGALYVLSTNPVQTIQTYQCGAAVFDLKYIGTAQLLIACGDGSIRGYDLTTRTLSQPVFISSQAVRCLGASTDAHWIAAGCSDNNVYLLEHNTWKPAHTLQGHQGSVFCLQFIQDGKQLWTGGRDAKIHVWDLDPSPAHAHEIPAHLFTINHLCLHPSGTLMATAGRDKHIKIFDVGTRSLLKVIDAEKYGAHINSVNKLFWSGPDNWLISCGDDRSVMAWEIEITGD